MESGSIGAGVRERFGHSVNLPNSKGRTNLEISVTTYRARGTRTSKYAKVGVVVITAPACYSPDFSTKAV